MLIGQQVSKWTFTNNYKVTTPNLIVSNNFNEYRQANSNI